MADKLNLPDIGTLGNPVSARAAINTNFTAIENAFDNTLSRDGTSPNQMEADIDLNGNDLLNVKRIDADEIFKNGVPFEQAVAYSDKRFQLLSGTGSQTNFTLEVDPGSLGNLYVSVAGLDLKPGIDYNYSGLTLSFVVAPASGTNNIYVRYDEALPTGVTNSTGVTYTPPSSGILENVDSFLDSLDAGYRFGDRPAPPRLGFFKDDNPTTKLHRFRDRVFFGDAVPHTGRRTAPYGGTWASTLLATWLEKNSQVTVLSSEGRIGFLAGSHRASGETSTGATIGLAGFTYNEGTTTTARAGYFDATAVGASTSATYGIEVAVSNRGVDAQATAYGVDTGAVIGQHMTPEGGTGYTLGDSDTPAPVATQPSTLALNISAGSGGTATKRWNLGIRFGSNAITGTDGVTGTGIAIGLAKGHTLQWRASASILGATLRSDVTAVGSQDVGLLFKNNEVQVIGTTEIAIARFQVDTVGTPVNSLTIKNGRTGIAPTLIGDGTDTNVGLTLQTKAAGTIRLTGQGGTAESLRAIFNAAYVNFLTVTGAVASGSPTLAAAGSDSNINLVLQGKGTGTTRLADSAGAAKVEASTAGLGFFAAAPTAKPSITGSRGGNAALASLLTGLSNLGLVADNTTA